MFYCRQSSRLPYQFDRFTNIYNLSNSCHITKLLLTVILIGFNHVNHVLYTTVRLGGYIYVYLWNEGHNNDMLVVLLTLIYTDPWGNVPKSRTLNTYKNATKIVFFYVLICQFNMRNSVKKTKHSYYFLIWMLRFPFYHKLIFEAVLYAHVYSHAYDLNERNHHVLHCVINQIHSSSIHGVYSRECSHKSIDFYNVSFYVVMQHIIYVRVKIITY